MRRFTPELAGKVRMMPLPRFESGDAPTTTWGGTMVGICRSSPHPQEAWKLLEFLYLGPEAHRARLAAGDPVLPAVWQYWDDPAYHAPEPVFRQEAERRRFICQPGGANPRALHDAVHV